MSYMKNTTRSLRLLVALMLVALTVPFITWRSSNAAPENASQSPAPPQSQDRKLDNKLHRVAKPIRDQYIVVLNRDTPAEQVDPIANELVGRHGGTTRYIYQHAIKGFSIQMPEAAAIALSNDPRVQYVEEDAEARLETTQTTPNWGLDRVDQRNLPLDNTYHFANVNTGAGVHVYVVDSGIQNTHSEFRNPNGVTRVVRDYDGVWDFQNGNDCNGHGTFVAGVVGSNSFGVAKGATLHAIRVFGCGPSTFTSTIIGGIDWVANDAHLQKPAVMNMSFTVGSIDYGLEDAVRRAIEKGITCVVAAGNSNIDASDISPQRVAEAITVGATDMSDNRAAFSNFGPFVDVFAPGVNITSTSNIDVNGNGSLDDARQDSGTSFAAPFVAGIAARFLQGSSVAVAASVQGVIKNNSTPDLIPDPGAGSPNLLCYSEIHNKLRAETLITSIKESDLLVDTGLDVAPNEWPNFTGFGQIWSGMPPSSQLNGPQGWNTIAYYGRFPLQNSRPFSLIGFLNDQTFYIGLSNALRTNFSVSKRLSLLINDDLHGDGSGEFMCTVQIWGRTSDVSADFVSQSVPTVLLPGQVFPVSITMKNVGPTTWIKGDDFKLSLLPESVIWNAVRIPLPNDVPPGATVTFNFNATAPSTPGNYNFQWQMNYMPVERFGDVTPNVPITVLAWSNQAEFVSQSVPKAMYGGESYNVSVTLKNVGNTTWQTSSNYWLGSQNPQDNMTWGMNRVWLPSAVPPGGTITIPFTVTAPGKSATYNFQWRMVQDGVEWFGPQTPNVPVTVKPPPCVRC